MKTVQEWSLAFDQAYDNVTSHKAPGLNEYEKSVFLTNAQEVVVAGLYNGSFGKAFESTEDVANYLAPLVRQVTMQVRNEADTDVYKIDPNKSHIYQLPAEADEILFRTLELCTLESDCDENGEKAVIVPVTQDEYWRTVNNPFKTYNSRRVLRLIFSKSSEDNAGYLFTDKYTDLITDRVIKTYVVRYIARPEPIILEDLHEVGQAGLEINGRYQAKTCLLDEAIHQAILSEAVRAAKAAWQN